MEAPVTKEENNNTLTCSIKNFFFFSFLVVSYQFNKKSVRDIVIKITTNSKMISLYGS